MATEKMKRKTWKTRIKKACTQAGTYRPFFDNIIDELAGILERRDAAMESFDESGGQVLVEHTNKNGSTNLEQNPALRLVNDLNRDALAYWRDLGLTPAGLKRLNENLLKQEERKSFADVLNDLGI